MPIQPATALQSLIAHPKTFLSKYPIRIAGAKVASGIIQYYIYNRDFGHSLRPGSVLRTQRMHDTECFYIDNQGMHGGHGFQAHSVEMVQSNVAAVPFYTLPAAGGPDIMVTGALSGCTFLVDVGAGGAIQCAHLQPNGESGTALNNRMLGQHDAVYGRNNYSHLHDAANVNSFDRTVTIIGVRRNGEWKVYAQKLDTMQAMSIRSVHRIYPA